MTSKRWPGWVYDSGDEPDPRFSLANERTFLAWIRTTLGLLAGAAAVDALDLPISHLLQQAIAVVLALAAVVAAAQAWFGWARTERAMRRHDPMPPNVGQIVVAVAVALVAVALVVTSLSRG